MVAWKLVVQSLFCAVDEQFQVVEKHNFLQLLHMKQLNEQLNSSNATKNVWQGLQLVHLVRLILIKTLRHMDT